MAVILPSALCFHIIMGDVCSMSLCSSVSVASIANTTRRANETPSFVCRVHCDQANMCFDTAYGSVSQPGGRDPRRLLNRTF